MRKLILEEWLSLDGFAADVNGELSFMESVTHYADEEQLSFLDGIDNILLGAKTYELFDFWPTATVQQEIIADKLNSIPKIIFSGTMNQAPWGLWPEAILIKTDAATAVRKLKS